MFVCSNGYIYFSKYCDDSRAKVSTGIKHKGKGINTSLLKKSEQLTLSRIEAAVVGHEESCRRSQDEVLKSDVEDIVRNALGRKSVSRKGFVPDFEAIIDGMQSGKILKVKSQERYSESTVTLYRQSLRYMQEFSKDTGTPLTYDIDAAWISRLVQWFNDRNFSQNTLSSFGGGFRGFLGIAYRLGKHKNKIFETDAMTFAQEESDNIAVSPEEIHYLYSMKLSKPQTRARDIFVLGCLTGPRSKDINRINEYKVRGNLIEVFTNKTGVKVVIPLHPIVKEIIEKYGEGNLPVIRRSSLNKTLTLICKKAVEGIASFKEEHLCVITKGGVKKAAYYPKWEMVSTHTWRRSFATNAYKAGVPTRRIMLITGHKTESAFMKYIKIENEENARELLDHPFFKPASYSKTSPKRLLRLNRHRKK